MVRRTLVTAGALLVGFHAWLLVSQAWAGELADPGLLVRWGVAGGLVWALSRLRRRGHSLVRGRRAVTIWLLAALLHGPALADRLSSPASVDAQIFSTALAELTSAAGMVLGVLLLFGVSIAKRRRVSAPLLVDAPADGYPSLFAAGFGFLVAPRPPPAH